MTRATVLVAVALAVLAACANQTASRSTAAAPIGPAPSSSPTSTPAARPKDMDAPALSASCSHAISTACDGSPPPDARDVLPIFEKRCFSCHTGDGVAADEHDFSRVGALRAARTEIADEVSTCAMPPRARLDDEEARALLRWAACGRKSD